MKEAEIEAQEEEMKIMQEELDKLDEFDQLKTTINNLKGHYSDDSTSSNGAIQNNRFLGADPTPIESPEPPKQPLENQRNNLTQHSSNPFLLQTIFEQQNKNMQRLLLPQNQPTPFDGEDLTSYQPFILAFERMIEQRCSDESDCYYYLLQRLK